MLKPTVSPVVRALEVAAAQDGLDRSTSTLTAAEHGREHHALTFGHGPERLFSDSETERGIFEERLDPTALA
jgi:hypothetical protein